MSSVALVSSIRDFGSDFPDTSLVTVVAGYSSVGYLLGLHSYPQALWHRVQLWMGIRVAHCSSETPPSAQSIIR